MVTKMAAQMPRGPSPPLPPDPSTPGHANSQYGQQQPTYPATPSKGQRSPQRHDSLRPVSPDDTTLLQQRRPIKDAVNDAANSVLEHSPATNQLDPAYIQQLTQEIAAQVTEQVMQNMQSAGATPTPVTRSHYPPPPPPATAAYEPRSPIRSPAESSSQRFTPPTPDLANDVREERDYACSSPEPPLSDVGSSFSRHSADSGRSNRSNDTPKPFFADAAKGAKRNSYTSRRRSGTADSQERQSQTTANNRRRRDSRESDMSFDGASKSRSRPTRLPSDVEETTLERVWQPLFDSEGKATARLSQFLRGLALHLIEAYEPKWSLVVTPDKMLRFMEETRIAQDHYPWNMIFGGTMNSQSISMMYQKLLCQHHLVQEPDRHDRQPSIPGLTPTGFFDFMTCLIQAHPDSEYERIAKAVMNLPISNADTKTERFPKELSRRLFPRDSNIPAQQRLVSSMNHEPAVFSRLAGASAMPPPPATAPPPAFPERERMPYSQSSAPTSAFDDEDFAGPPIVQIERERKPYTAKEGSGKTYAGDDTSSRAPQTSYRTEAPPVVRRNSRNNPAPPQPSFIGSAAPSEPMPIPSRPHRQSVGQNGAPGPYSRSARRSSPPLRNPYARSEPDFVGNSNTQYGSTPLHTTLSNQQYSPEAADERYRSRSRVDDVNNVDARGFPSSIQVGRSHNGGDRYEYGTTAPPSSQGGGNGAPPVGSYPTRDRRHTMNSNGTDDRRRSMYNPSTTSGYAGDGGTDGYGSFAGGVNGGGGGYYPPPAQSSQSQSPGYGSGSQY